MPSENNKKKSKISFDDVTLKKYNIISTTDRNKKEEICVMTLLEIGKLLNQFFEDLPCNE